MIGKTWLLASASFGALIATPAYAQQAPATGGVIQGQDAPATGTVDRTDPTQDADALPEEEIVVTGVRASLVGALNVKRESTQIVDSIVSEDVGKLPDNNVIEALQRVTGIQVTNRGSGEAQGISIRGLPDALTTLNGRNIFTASGRAFALADIPSNLVSRIDVYKTRGADQIETGLAGQIDVMTRRPFDFDGFAISGVARGIYLEQDESFNPNVSALVSNRWETGIGDIGILINGSYVKTSFRDQSITAGAMVPFATERPSAGTNLTPLERIFPGPNNANWSPGLDRGLPTTPGSTILYNGLPTEYYLSRDAVFSPDVEGERERPAIAAALQWSPNSTSTYTAEFFWTQFNQTTFNRLMFSFVDWWGSLGPNPGATFDLFEGTNIIKSRTVGNVFGFNSGDFTKSSTDSFVYALNGRWETNPNGYITADLSYQNSEFNTQFMAMRIDRVASQITVDFNAKDGFPAYNFSDNALLTDPTAWNVAEFYDNANRSKGDALTLHVDAVQNFDEGFLRQVKAGIRYDDRKAADSVRTQDARGLGQRLSALDPGLQHVNRDFFQGRANVPTSWLVPNGYYISQNADAIRELYRSTVAPQIRLSNDLSLTEVFNINEVSMTAYVQADAEIDIFGRPLRVQAGLRYVDVDTDLVFTDRFNGESRTASQVTDALLPNLTVRFDITDKLRARFSYGETLRRPGFGDLNPFLNLTGDLTRIGFGSGSGGNPDLQPTSSKNFDLALEYYFARDSAIYTTLFRREIEGLVVPLTSRVVFPTPPLNDSANTVDFAITRPTNASDGVLEGVEVGLVLFPRLPGIFDGLGVQGSVTILDSKQNIPQANFAGEIVGQEETSFFGVSDLSYNATLAYERGPVGARLSYVWRKEFLANNEARLFANPIGVWRRPESSLDFQLTYAVTDHLGVTFDAVNITQEVQQSYYRFDDAGGPDTHNLGTTLLPRTFAVGVRYSFD